MSATITKPVAPSGVDRQVPGPKELLRTLGTLNLQREAANRGMTLSAYLERIDPSVRYKGTEDEGLDAFERLIRASGIVTQSDFRSGYYADEFDRFLNGTNCQVGPDCTRALAVEWAARVWRRVRFAGPAGTRSLFNYNLEGLGTVARPYVDAAQARMNQVAPPIRLEEIVAMQTPIDSDAYRAFYLTDVAADQRLVRVTPGTPLPTVTVTGADRTIQLYKYGRAMDIPYETLRRQRIDKVAFWIMHTAVQTETDKVAAAIDVLINGDGNANTAATNHNQSVLDTGSTPTLKGYLAFKLKFANAYMCTHILAPEATILAVLLLNTGSANIPLATLNQNLGVGGLIPMNPSLSDGIRYGISSDVSANVVLGIDARFALEQVTEIGSDIAESQRFVQRQTEIMTFSEVEGYAVLDTKASRTWTTNA